MRAVILERFGGPEVLRIHGVSDPTPGVAQVRVRIAATALNRADVLQREGRYPPPAPKPGDILGLEFSGTVDALGPGVTAWKPGDRVFGLLGEGGYAEQVVTHERMLMPMLPGMSFDDAAAIPEVYFTAYDALVDRARVEMGEAVLIHAGGSGVGTAAIQLARAMGAGRLLTTVGSDEKAWRCLDLGADRAINYRTETFEDVVMAETGGKGADVIVDFVGGPYAQRNVNAVRTMGRVILVGLLGGARGEIDMTTWFVKRVSLIATTLRARPLEQKIALTQRFIEKLLPLFGDGRLRAIVDRTFPLDQVADAHRYMEENRNFGKIVVRCQ